MAKKERRESDGEGKNSRMQEASRFVSLEISSSGRFSLFFVLCRSFLHSVMYPHLSIFLCNSIQSLFFFFASLVALSDRGECVFPDIEREKGSVSNCI